MCFKLIWTSQNGAVTLQRGEYANIPEVADDPLAAEGRLQGEFPATADFHYPHDIQAGTWQVVAIESARSVRAQPE
jgi:hypothetical protein